MLEKDSMRATCPRAMAYDISFIDAQEGYYAIISTRVVDARAYRI